MSITMIRALRQPLAWLAMAALVVLALLALETTGSSSTPAPLPLKISKAASSAPTTGNPTKHCTDDHGADADNSPTCRGISEH